jgi:hypothetical protein
MAFTIDPTLPGPINAVVTVQPIIRCTNGVPFTVLSQSANAGGPFGGPPTTGILNDGAGHQIAYSITHIAGGTGLGMGGTGDISLAVAGSVNSVDYADAYVCEAACSYTDTITFEVTY